MTKIPQNNAEIGTMTNGDHTQYRPPDFETRVIKMDGEDVEFGRIGNTSAPYHGLFYPGVYSSMSVMEFIQPYVDRLGICLYGVNAPNVGKSGSYGNNYAWRQAQYGLQFFEQERKKHKPERTFIEGYSGGGPLAFAAAAQAKVDLVIGVNSVANMSHMENILTMKLREMIGIVLAKFMPDALELYYDLGDGVLFRTKFHALLQGALDQNKEAILKEPGLKKSFADDYRATHHTRRGGRTLRKAIALLGRWGYAIRNKLSRRKKDLKLYLVADVGDEYVDPANTEWLAEQLYDFEGLIDYVEGSQHQTLPLLAESIHETINAILRTGSIPDDKPIPKKSETRGSKKESIRSYIRHLVRVVTSLLSTGKLPSHDLEARLSSKHPRRIRLPLQHLEPHGGTV